MTTTATLPTFSIFASLHYMEVKEATRFNATRGTDGIWAVRTSDRTIERTRSTSAARCSLIRAAAGIN